MTNYKTQSAKVLNDADRFERIMAWREFTEEQDTRLWAIHSEEVDRMLWHDFVRKYPTNYYGTPPGVRWYPGVPLLVDPRRRFYFSEEAGGETVRYLFDILETDPMHPDYHDGWKFIPRCTDCLVSWVGEEEPCWMCGEDRPLSIPSNKFKSMVLVDGIEYVTDFDRISFNIETFQHFELPGRHEPEDSEVSSAYWQAQHRIMRLLYGETRLPRERPAEGVPIVWNQEARPRSDWIIEHNRGYSRRSQAAPRELWVTPSPVVDLDFMHLYDPEEAEAFPRFYLSNEMWEQLHSLDVNAQPAIEPPVISRRNEILEEYLGREELRTTNPLAYELDLARRRRR